MSATHSFPYQPGANAATGPDPTTQVAAGLDPQVEAECVKTAKRLYALRRRRNELLDADMFSDPAWDMLLDLFITGAEGRRLSVSGVCIGSHAPAATALRYLALLQERGLVRRMVDSTDGRRTLVELTELGQRSMQTLLMKF
jgi:hypothetical protein